MAAFDNTEERTAVRDSWPCQGLTSELDLDPFFAVVAERREDLSFDELEVVVDHPVHVDERTRVPLSRGVELTTGQTVYEVRVRLAPPVFWPELTLSVRDANTREHLENVELSYVIGTLMGMPRLPGTGESFTSLGGGLSSPLALLGGRGADDPEDRVAGLAVRRAADAAPQRIDLSHSVPLETGFNLYARAPGYAWGSIPIDVASNDEHELLLGPAAALNVRLANVQLERYAELEVTPWLVVWWFRPDGGRSYLRWQWLDERLATEGVRLEGVEPGEYAATVELRGGEWKEKPVLASEQLALAAHDAREVVLALSDPPAPPERAALGGVVSFPAFGGENKVRLQLYHPIPPQLVSVRAGETAEVIVELRRK